MKYLLRAWTKIFLLRAFCDSNIFSLNQNRALQRFKHVLIHWLSHTSQNKMRCCLLLASVLRNQRVHVKQKYHLALSLSQWEPTENEVMCKSKLSLGFIEKWVYRKLRNIFLVN